jgi:hypothetical protein
VGSDDALERWSYERDRREDHSISRRYVSDDAIGYEDLDEYGGWRDTPDYGTIWFPHTTVVGWAPYRYGHWVWIAPWGYTWVDDEPWGFAPFHYGRWVVVNGAWGWVPCRPEGVVGVAYVRPVYAPALVAWVGGPRMSVGITVGGGPAVGWFPLGPREVYVPSYPVSRTYVNNVNITNTTVNTTVVNNYYNNVVVNKNVNVNNVRYVNQTVPGAVTATSPQTFTSGESVHSHLMRVNEREMASAPVVAATPPMAPTKQSVEGVGRPGAARPPDPVVNREVVAKTAPPPPPARFERQQEAIQQNGGRPLAVSQVREIQQQQREQPRAEVRMAPPARQAITPRENEGNSAPPQNVNRPLQQPNNVPQNNRSAISPVNAERPNNTQPNQPNRPATADRSYTPPPNAQPNNERTDRPPSARPANPNERPNTPPNGQPNRPSNSDRPYSNDRSNTSRQYERTNTPPPNEPPSRPANNDRPNNDRPNNDRPPSAQSSNPPPNGNPQLEQQHRQELENVRRQQDQQRQRVEQQQGQERQRVEQQRADDQRRQQMQQQQERQLQEMERRHAEEQQRMQQRQQQEHQQQRPPQAERQQQPPPQAERQQQPPPRQQQQQQQQQPPPRQQDRAREREKP